MFNLQDYPALNQILDLVFDSKNNVTRDITFGQSNSSNINLRSQLEQYEYIFINIPNEENQREAFKQFIMTMFYFTGYSTSVKWVWRDATKCDTDMQIMMNILMNKDKLIKYIKLPESISFNIDEWQPKAYIKMKQDGYMDIFIGIENTNGVFLDLFCIVSNVNNAKYLIYNVNAFTAKNELKLKRHYQGLSIDESIFEKHKPQTIVSPSINNGAASMIKNYLINNTNTVTQKMNLFSFLLRTQGKGYIFKENMFNNVEKFCNSYIYLKLQDAIANKLFTFNAIPIQQLDSHKLSISFELEPNNVVCTKEFIKLFLSQAEYSEKYQNYNNILQNDKLTNLYNSAIYLQPFTIDFELFCTFKENDKISICSQFNKNSEAATIFNGFKEYSKFNWIAILFAKTNLIKHFQNPKNITDDMMVNIVNFLNEIGSYAFDYDNFSAKENKLSYTDDTLNKKRFNVWKHYIFYGAKSNYYYGSKANYYYSVDLYAQLPNGNVFKLNSLTKEELFDTFPNDNLNFKIQKVKDKPQISYIIDIIQPNEFWENLINTYHNAFHN